MSNQYSKPAIIGLEELRDLLAVDGRKPGRSTVRRLVWRHADIFKPTFPFGSGGYSYKRVQAGGAAKFRDVPDKNGFSHVEESLQYLLVGGGEARLLVKRPHSGPRAELAVMG